MNGASVDTAAAWFISRMIRGLLPHQFFPHCLTTLASLPDLVGRYEAAELFLQQLSNLAESEDNIITLARLAARIREGKEIMVRIVSSAGLYPALVHLLVRSWGLGKGVVAGCASTPFNTVERTLRSAYSYVSGSRFCSSSSSR